MPLWWGHGRRFSGEQALVDQAEPSMGRGRRSFRGLSLKERQAQRRQLLLEAALALYGTHGVFAVTVREICAEAGLTERYFYESFKNSEKLFEALYSQQVAWLEAQLLTVLAQEQPPERWIEAMLTALFATLKANPRMARVVFIESMVMRETHGTALEAMNRFHQITQRMLTLLVPTLAQHPLPLSLMAAGLNGFVIQVMVHWVLNGYQEDEQAVFESCRLAFIGIYRHLLQMATVEPSS